MELPAPGRGRGAAPHDAGADPAAGTRSEARLYAEDPARGFLPSTGTIMHYRPGTRARVDSALREGLSIRTAFDPDARQGHRARGGSPAGDGWTDRALARLELLGVSTNASFVRMLLDRKDIRRGEQDTGPAGAGPR